MDFHWLKMGHQNLGIILENKVFQKLTQLVSKTVTSCKIGKKCKRAPCEIQKDR